MTTEYCIELGYQSGYSFDGSDDERWTILVDEVRGLIARPELIAAEATAYGAPGYCCEKKCMSLLDACNAYQNIGLLDAPITIKGNMNDRHIIGSPDAPVAIEDSTSGRYIVQYTTGGDVRTLKEHVRRAFCRLVIQRMHMYQIEICLTVS